MPSDEGYREIQLNGKQMIFLFMATTIVAVVIFLCGVTVGRGVRNAPAVAGAEPAVGAAPAVDIAPVPPDSQAANKPAAGPAPAVVPPAPPPEPDGGSGAEQAAVPRPRTAPPAIAASEKPAGSKPQTSAAPAPAAPSVSPAAATPASEPVGEGYAVQVVALRDRNQADGRAKDLMAKGYPAYVVAPSEAGGVFRVRIGKFKERRQAEAVMRRLKKEEKSDSFLVPTR